MCWLSAQRADEVASGTAVWRLDSLAAGSMELLEELLRRLIAETSAICGGLAGMPTTQDDSYEVLGFRDGADQKVIKKSV